MRYVARGLILSLQFLMDLKVLSLVWKRRRRSQ